MRAAIFVGSSTEGKTYAQAVATVIERLGYEVRPWWNTFRLGDSFIQDLVSAAEKADGAIFVATPDDRRLMRHHGDFVSRDNVLFEYGLFSGKLGKSRTVLAIVGNAARPSDLQGVNCILLPRKTRKRHTWTHYKERFIHPTIHNWLRDEFATLSDVHSVTHLRDHIYCLESEARAKEEGLFQRYARESKGCNYLVLRGRTILGKKGEIADLCTRADPQLTVRLLMVDFGSLTEQTFEIMKANMDLQFKDLNTERRLAEKRLANAKNLFRGITFKCRLLPINIFPAIKLRLYDHCGFFNFYHTGIGGKRREGARAVFNVHAPQGESPLLATFRQMYEHLWDEGRDPTNV